MAFERDAKKRRPSTTLGDQMSAAIQWIIILVLVASVPFSYLRTAERKPAPLALRIVSYIGAICLGAVTATLLHGFKIIGIPWVIFVILIFVLVHRAILARLVRGKKSG